MDDSRIRAALGLARGVAGWHLGLSSGLVSAVFAVTNRCNLRCSYCNTPFLDPTDLPLSQVELLFGRLRELGVSRLGLTGGEPMVRKDIGELVELAKARGFWLTMNSNLTLLERRKEAVRGVDLFFTSLDGPKEQHEAARGAGSFQGVVDAATRIVAEGRPVVAICVVTPHNLGCARELLEIARRAGFRVHFQPQCFDTAIVRGTRDSALTNERLRAFFSEVLRLRREGLPVASSKLYLEELSNWPDFSQTAVLDPEASCLASRGFLYVDPRGDAYPCAYTKGISAPVSLLGPDWRNAVRRELPCTRCSVGPYLEFNLLYRKPVRALADLVRSYG